MGGLKAHGHSGQALRPHNCQKKAIVGHPAKTGLERGTPAPQFQSSGVVRGARVRSKAYTEAVANG